MSAICGALSLDGAPVAHADIEAIAALLAPRAPDGTHFWSAPGVALGHGLNATTPQSLVERLPLSDPASRCTISADVRLDNRAELLAALELNDGPRVIGDGQLILRAYLRWGDDCPAHLLGDFAFAIWDGARKRLFCARDHMGMRQFLYHHRPGRHFLFATDAHALLAHPAVDAPLNHDRLADYLGNMEGADLVSTFFEGIVRLPPAHSLAIDAAGLTLRQYWQLAVESELKLPTDAAYRDAFLAQFAQAVECRIVSTGRLGAMVSGGLDSNSIVALAAALRKQQGEPSLPTFSAAGPDPDSCPETRAIMTAIAAPHIDPTLVDHANLGDLAAPLISATRDSAEPFDATAALLHAVYLTARRKGITIVLDGATSDALFESSFHTALLLRRGQLPQLLREAKGERAFWGAHAPVWRALVASCWQAFAPASLRAERFWAGRRAADRTFVDRIARHGYQLDVARALARRRSVQERDLADDAWGQATRVRLATHPNAVVARERYDRIAGACGIEARDPFMDIRLIRFCLTLPRDQLQRDGWPKWILRRAMEGRMPASLIWRRGKEHLGGEFSRAALADKPDEQPLFVTGEPLNNKFSNRIETIFLANWFAAMRRKGWNSGFVATKGIDDDDQQE